MHSKRLYKLIKSLSRSELRYISININKYEGNESIDSKLFNHIYKSKNYKEEVIKNKILTYSKTPLSILKNQLYNKILTLLVDYEMLTSNDLRVKKLIYEAEILYKRNFINDAYKRLLKAKTIAKNADLYFVLFEILRLQVKILLSNVSIKNNETIESIFEEKFEILSLISSEIEINHSAVQYHLLYNNESETLSTKKEFAEHLIKKFTNKTANTGSLRSKVIFLYLLSEAYFSLNLHSKALEINQQQYSLFNRARLKEQHKSLFIPIIINLITKCIRLKQFKKAQNLLKEFKSFSDSLNHTGEYYLLQIYTNNQMCIYDEKLINAALKFTSNNESKIQQAYLYKIIFCILSSYFCGKKYKKAAGLLAQTTIKSVKITKKGNAYTLFNLRLQIQLKNVTLIEKLKTEYIQNTQQNPDNLTVIESEYRSLITSSKSNNFTKKITTEDTFNVDDYFSLLKLYKPKNTTKKN